MLDGRIDLARKPSRLRNLLFRLPHRAWVPRDPSGSLASIERGAQRWVKPRNLARPRASPMNAHNGSWRAKSARPWLGRASRATASGAPGGDDSESAAGPRRERVQASASPAAAIMTSRIEASRKHGRFDSRWPKRRLRVTSDWGAAAAVGLEAVPDGLDWVAFSRRYFPGPRRHDLAAISAYHEHQHVDAGRTGARGAGGRSGATNPSSPPGSGEHPWAGPERPDDRYGHGGGAGPVGTASDAIGATRGRGRGAHLRRNAWARLQRGGRRVRTQRAAKGLGVVEAAEAPNFRSDLQ